MSDVISNFRLRIDRINVVYGLIIPVSFFTIVAILQWIFTPNYFQPGSLGIYLTIIISVFFVFIFHLLFMKKMQKVGMRLFYVFYHVALISFCSYVAPYLSGYEFLWVVLAIGVDLIFGRRWIALTAFWYILTVSFVFTRTHQSFDTITLLRTSLQVVGIFSTALLVSKYRQISDDERDELDSASAATSFERQRLLSLINNMGEAVVATDKKGKILIYNAAVLNLLNTNQTLENKSINTLLNLRDKTKNKVKLTELLAKSPLGVTSEDYAHEFKPNDSINMYINVAPVRLGFKQNTDSGYIIIMRDITREKSLEEERDEFISVVSHELRTPIAIAEGDISNAQFINQREKGSESISKSLNQAHEQILFLANMINDLATLSRAERSDVELELSEIKPNQLLQSFADDYVKQAKEKKLQLNITAANNVKPIYTSDLYLREILQNFITNAIKYTKKGSVLIHVRSKEDGSAVFSVADTGIGLSKADEKHIYDKFFRSEDYRTRESNGTGLGLYVTAKLAQRLQAKIDVESQLNKGSTFTITVPNLNKKV